MLSNEFYEEYQNYEKLKEKMSVLALRKKQEIKDDKKNVKAQEQLLLKELKKYSFDELYFFAKKSSRAFVSPISEFIEKKINKELNILKFSCSEICFDFFCAQELDNETMKLVVADLEHIRKIFTLPKIFVSFRATRSYYTTLLVVVQRLKADSPLMMRDVNIDNYPGKLVTNKSYDALDFMQNILPFYYRKELHTNVKTEANTALLLLKNTVDYEAIAKNLRNFIVKSSLDETIEEIEREKKALDKELRIAKKKIRKMIF